LGTRCFGDGDPVYAAYHDHEWGRPVTDERGLFELVCLEAFQAGLSWRTILRRRDALRAAFAGFDPDRVAALGSDDVERLLADARIIRHRGKVEAAIANAHATLALREAGTPLPRLIWSFRPPAGPAPASWAEVPASTDASRALAKALRRRGFRFLGATAAYALMQAAGLVNDHLAGCPVRAEAEAAQGGLPR
jgi:DNA-3-methyladenine glycosylase I